MQSTSARRKYTSLILSVLLHVLLLLLLYLIKMQRGLPFEEKQEKRLTPAPVSFEPQPPAQQLSQQITQAQSDGPDDSTEESQEQAIPQVAPDEESVKQNMPETDGDSSGSAPEAVSQEISDFPQLPKRRRRKSSITGAAFMNAFKQSIIADQEKKYGLQNGAKPALHQRMSRIDLMSGYKVIILNEYERQ